MPAKQPSILRRAFPTFARWLLPSPPPARAPRRRAYAAAARNGPAQDFTNSTTTADAETRFSLEILRNRFRELERDNDYVRRWLSLLENNVIGADGIKFQSKVTRPLDENTPAPSARRRRRRPLSVREILRLKARAPLSAAGWEENHDLNSQIEDAWADFQRPCHHTANGVLGGWEATTLLLRTVARDGEALVRLIRNASNPHRFAVQLIESDLLDHNLNALRGSSPLANLPEGHTIRMGVELDPSRRPAAYWLRLAHPGDVGYFGAPGGALPWRHERVPAADIIHLRRAERPDQTRGVPWGVSAILRLKLLAGYEEAELVAARAGSCKMGFLEKQLPDGETPSTDESGTIPEEYTPGYIEELPWGTKFVANDPTHPNGNYPAFRKAILQGVGAGLGISYPNIGMDLEGVNYSSIRAGVLEEREEYKKIQRWFIECYLQPLFTAWLPWAILAGQIDPGGMEIEDLDRPLFVGRRWPWVDPTKDLNASIAAVANRFKSTSDIIMERGDDPEDIFAACEHDRHLAATHGIILPPDLPPPTPPGAPAPEPDDDMEEEMSSPEDDDDATEEEDTPPQEESAPSAPSAP